MSAAIATALRQAYPGVLARALAFVGSVPDAEDAVQEAMARALAKWPDDGVPDAPEAWLLTVAKNVQRDKYRKSKWETPQQDTLEILAEQSPWARLQLSGRPRSPGWHDELVRLMFACCHPALEPGESAAVCLATVLGMATSEVAAAFLAAPRTMEQRLMRARRRLRERGDLDFPRPDEAAERLDAVLRVIHLLFNEGFWSTSDDDPIRSDLCQLAIELGVEVARAFPDDTEAGGLLVLMTLHDARKAARMGPEGPITLPLQDRTLWDHESIGAAIEILNDLIDQENPGPYLVEAAIAAVHSQAPSAESTDWAEIARLYEVLEQWRPTPAVRVNRAFAAARAVGAERGLELLQSEDFDVARYPYSHVVRGTLLDEVGQSAAAIEALQHALDVARNDAERRHIRQQILDIQEREAGNAIH